MLRDFRTQSTVAEVPAPNVLKFANGTSAPMAGGALHRIRHPFEFFDFGTRRRFSRDWHEEMVTTLKREVPQYFKGTSNVYLAKKYGLAAIGTMAHEYLQTFQAVGVQLRNFQKAALEAWVQEYRGDLGVALTDVVGMDAFLADFDLYFAKLFDGLRHDSGDPVVWGEKALAHYQPSLRVDPHTKRLVFSDGLNVPKALALYRALLGPGAVRLRHRHRPDQRHGRAGAEHRDEAHRVQRPAGRQTLGHAGQDAVHR